MQPQGQKSRILQPAADVNEKELEIDELIRYVETLMRWYSGKRSFYLANRIVSKLEYIRGCIQESETFGKRMECDRLIKQWRYLASRSLSPGG